MIVKTAFRFKLNNCITNHRKYFQTAETKLLGRYWTINLSTNSYLVESIGSQYYDKFRDNRKLTLIFWDISLKLWPHGGDGGGGGYYSPLTTRINRCDTNTLKLT